MSISRLAVCAGLVSIVAACGGSSGSRFTDAPASYLLRLGQLQSPDFTVDKPAVNISPLDLAGGDQRAANQLSSDDFRAAASVSYARTVEFATSNGPIEIINTVARFARDGGAHSWFDAETSRRDAQPGEVAMSTGALGDEAHANSLIATTTGGLQAVQITLQWRVANVVVVLQVRGRYGGTRLDDALVLAHKQTSTQLR